MGAHLPDLMAMSFRDPQRAKLQDIIANQTRMLAAPKEPEQKPEAAPEPTSEPKKRRWWQRTIL